MDCGWLGEQNEGHGKKTFDPFDELITSVSLGKTVLVCTYVLLRYVQCSEL
jgi:hypothetical protein